MKTIKKLLIIFSIIIFSSCEREEYELGTLVNPSNLTVSAELQGQDADNPFGDGSGLVTLTAIASDAITYKFIINEVEFLEPSGVFTRQFSNLGTNTYEVQVIASGTAGLTTESVITVEVLYSYQPPADLVESLLTGNWRVMAEADGHIGVHDAASFHDGVNTFPEWYSAPAFQQSNTGMYDDRIVFFEDGTAEFFTQGSIFGNALALENDFTGNQGLTPNQFGEHQFYPADDFSFSWSISEGDDGYLHLNFTGNGFTGNYVGGNHQYVITYRNSDSSELYLKTIGLDTNAWYAKITNQE
jgi:hypothetical protein